MTQAAFRPLNEPESPEPRAATDSFRPLETARDTSPRQPRRFRPLEQSPAKKAGFRPLAPSESTPQQSAPAESGFRPLPQSTGAERASPTQPAAHKAPATPAADATTTEQQLPGPGPGAPDLDRYRRHLARFRADYPRAEGDLISPPSGRGRPEELERDEANTERFQRELERLEGMQEPYDGKYAGLLPEETDADRRAEVRDAIADAEAQWQPPQLNIPEPRALDQIGGVGPRGGTPSAEARGARTPADLRSDFAAGAPGAPGGGRVSSPELEAWQRQGEAPPEPLGPSRRARQSLIDFLAAQHDRAVDAMKAPGAESDGGTLDQLAATRRLAERVANKPDDEQIKALARTWARLDPNPDNWAEGFEKSDELDAGQAAKLGATMQMARETLAQGRAEALAAGDDGHTPAEMVALAQGALAKRMLAGDIPYDEAYLPQMPVLGPALAAWYVDQAKEQRNPEHLETAFRILDGPWHESLPAEQQASEAVIGYLQFHNDLRSRGSELMQQLQRDPNASWLADLDRLQYRVRWNLLKAGMFLPEQAMNTLASLKPGNDFLQDRADTWAIWRQRINQMLAEPENRYSMAADNGWRWLWTTGGETVGEMLPAMAMTAASGGSFLAFALPMMAIEGSHFYDEQLANLQADGMSLEDARTAALPATMAYSSVAAMTEALPWGAMTNKVGAKAFRDFLTNRAAGPLADRLLARGAQTLSVSAAEQLEEVIQSVESDLLAVAREDSALREAFGGDPRQMDAFFEELTDQAKAMVLPSMVLGGLASYTTGPAAMGNQLRQARQQAAERVRIAREQMARAGVSEQQVREAAEVQQEAQQPPEQTAEQREQAVQQRARELWEAKGSPQQPPEQAREDWVEAERQVDQEQAERRQRAEQTEQRLRESRVIEAVNDHPLWRGAEARREEDGRITVATPGPGSQRVQVRIVPHDQVEGQGSEQARAKSILAEIAEDEAVTGETYQGLPVPRTLEQWDGLTPEQQQQWRDRYPAWSLLDPNGEPVLGADATIFLSSRALDYEGLAEDVLSEEIAHFLDATGLITDPEREALRRWSDPRSERDPGEQIARTLIRYRTLGERLNLPERLRRPLDRVIGFVQQLASMVRRRPTAGAAVRRVRDRAAAPGRPGAASDTVTAAPTSGGRRGYTEPAAATPTPAQEPADAQVRDEGDRGRPTPPRDQEAEVPPAGDRGDREVPQVAISGGRAEARSRFSQQRLSERVERFAQQYEVDAGSARERAAARQGDRNAELNAMEPSSSFAGPIPTELLEHFEGRELQLRKVVRANVPGGTAEDYWGHLQDVYGRQEGDEIFLQGLEELMGGERGFRRKHVDDLLALGDHAPDAAFTAHMLKLRQSVPDERGQRSRSVRARARELEQQRRAELAEQGLSREQIGERIEAERAGFREQAEAEIPPADPSISQRWRQVVVDPAQVPPGTGWTLYGEYGVELHEEADGSRTLWIEAPGEAEYRAYPVEAIEEGVPADDGSFHEAQPPETSEDVPGATEQDLPFAARRADLDAEQRQVQDDFRTLLSDLDAADAAYDRLPPTQGGKILGADHAKLLSDAYAGNRRGRVRFGPAIGGLAADYARDRLFRTLENPPEPGGERTRPALLMTSGGPGSGKTTTLTEERLQQHDLVWDSVLSSQSEARRIVNRALRNGWDVELHHVYRPFDQAVQGVIDRAFDNGRPVPLAILPEAHMKAQNVAGRLVERFAGEEAVNFKAIANVAEDARVTAIDRVAEGGDLRYTDREALERIVRDASQQLRQRELRQGDEADRLIRDALLEGSAAAGASPASGEVRGRGDQGAEESPPRRGVTPPSSDTPFASRPRPPAPRNTRQMPGQQGLYGQGETAGLTPGNQPDLFAPAGVSETPAELPQTYHALDLTADDLRQAQAFSADAIPPAAYALGVKQYRDGAERPRAHASLTAEQRRQLAEGFRAARAGASQATSEDRSRGQGQEGPASGGLFAARRRGYTGDMGADQGAGRSAQPPQPPERPSGPVADKDGSPLEDLNGQPVPVNADGTITLYHRTTPEAAQQIRETGRFVSAENTNEVFFSTTRDGNAEGYGDTVVAVRAQPSLVRLDDAFRNGEVHVAVEARDLRSLQPSFDRSAPDQGGAPRGEDPWAFAVRRYPSADEAKADRKGKALIKRIGNDKAGEKIGPGSIVDYLADAVAAEMWYGLGGTTNRRNAQHVPESHHLVRARARGSQQSLQQVGVAVAQYIDDVQPGFLYTHRGHFERLADPERTRGSLAQAKTAEEGFGEWLRRYVQQPTEDQGGPPPDNLTQPLTQFLRARMPALLQSIEHARAAGEAHRARGVQAMQAALNNDTPPRKPLGERMGEGWSRFLYGIGAGSAIETRVRRRAYRALASYSRKLAKEVETAVYDSPADAIRAYQLSLHVPQEASRALYGDQSGSRQGLRVYVFGRGFADFSQEDLRKLVEAGFTIPTETVRHGDLLYLSDYTIQDIEDAIGEDRWADFESYGWARTALARHDQRQLPYPGVDGDLPPAALRKHMQELEAANPDFAEQYEALNRWMDQLLLVSVLSGEFDVDQAIRIKQAWGPDEWDLPGMEQTTAGYWPLPRNYGRPIRGKALGQADPSSGVDRAWGSEQGFAGIWEAVEARTVQALEAYVENGIRKAIRNLGDLVEDLEQVPLEIRAQIRRMLVPIPMQMKQVAELEPDEKRRVVANALNAQRARDKGVEEDKLPAGERIGPDDVVISEIGEPVWRRFKPGGGADVVSIWEGGERQYYQVLDPVLFSFFTRTEVPTTGFSRFIRWLAGVGQGLKEPWRRSITQTWPFALWNVVRDSVTATQLGTGWQTAFPGAPFLVGIWNRAAQRYPEAGVSGELLSRTFDAVSAPAHRTHVQHFIAAMKQGILVPNWSQMSAAQRLQKLPGQVKSATLKHADFLNYVSGARWAAESAETASREGAFVAARQRGESDMAAQYWHDVVSGNFGERSGNATAAAWLRAAGFLNPALQVTLQLYQRVTDPATQPPIPGTNRTAPVGSYVMWGRLAMLSMWSGAASAAYHLSLDEDDLERLNRRTDEDRMRYMHLKVPFTDDAWLRIPFDYGPAGAFQSIAWNIVGNQFRADPTKGKEMAWFLLGRSGDVPALVDFLGPHMTTMVELKTNHSFFFSNEIVPAYLAQTYRNTPELQYRDSTPMVYRRLGKLFGASPIKLRYGMRNILTQQWTDTLELGARLLNGDEGVAGAPMDEAANWPYIGRLFAREPRGWRTRAVRQLVEDEQAYLAARRLRDDLEQRGEYGERWKEFDQRVLELSALHELYLEVRRVADGIKQMRETGASEERIRREERFMTQLVEQTMRALRPAPQPSENPSEGDDDDGTR